MIEAARSRALGERRVDARDQIAGHTGGSAHCGGMEPKPSQKPLAHCLQPEHSAPLGSGAVQVSEVESQKFGAAQT
jgi:hypothetical protein